MKPIRKLGKIFTRACVAILLIAMAAPIHAATDWEIDQAIQDGLAWLATTQNPNGSFGSGYPLADTATAVLAFENEGHFPGGGTAYSGVVEAGLDYIFTRCYKGGIGPQTYGNPDSNGNGLGMYFSYNRYMYETGIVMQAIVASSTPDREVTTGGCAATPPQAPVTYRDVMVEVVDWLSWAQNELGSGRGGWDYSPNSWRGDNSVAQWPVLGLIAAEQWGIIAPAFVKSELNIWIDYIQNDLNGGSGYTHPNGIVNMSKTGGLLVEMYYVGDDKDTERAQDAINYLNSRWNVGYYSWYGNKGHPYAMFSVFKGLELMQVPVIPSAPANADTPAGDWWGDYADYLVLNQHAAGYWPGYYYWGPA
ncbi:MAG: hypothetical protein HKO99_00005, partial [Xanthomonadales bacterium]|nr:hypothetical protein [Xanthomonadales bacterium]